MGNEAGGPGPGAGGPAPDDAAAATSPEELAAQALEATQMEGAILDAGLAATGFEPGSAAPAGAGTDAVAGATAASAGADATARALFVAGTLDEIAAPIPIGFDPAATPGATATTDASTAEAAGADAASAGLGMVVEGIYSAPEPRATGTGFAARHANHIMVGGAAMVALIAFVSALNILTGPDGPATGSVAPSGAGAVVAPSAVSTPTATPDATSAPTPEPSVEPSAAATPAPSTPPTPVPQSVTLRGPIDASVMKKAGLQLSRHDVELVVFLDNGQVTGTMTLVVEEFPIGMILAGLDERVSGSNDPDTVAFKSCTTRMTMEGVVTGTYKAATGKLKGTTVFTPVSEDIHDCLKNKPKQITIDPSAAAKPSTVTWTAAFDGTKARGTLGLEPKTAFTATREE